MNVFLLNNRKDFGLQQELVWNEQDLTQDLGLKTLFENMAQNDGFLFEVAMKVILCGENSDLQTILYRQEIMKECLKNPLVIREIYDLANEALEKEKNNYWGIFRNYPNSVLYRSVELLEMLIEILGKLKEIARENAVKFKSAGFTRLFGMLQEELSEDYFQEMKVHLEALKFHDGVLMSAQLGKGNKGNNYVLRKLTVKKINWWQQIIKFLFPNYLEKNRPGNTTNAKGEVTSYTFFINPRDEAGTRSLRDLKDVGINLVANSSARSAEHILNFFKNMRTELAFYIGCTNLHKTLASLDEPVTFPNPSVNNEQECQYSNLYDVCLALNTKKQVTGNEGKAIGKKLTIITGANQGGKSTFLRSIGLAQIMMQCGMFVPAQNFKAGIHSSLITHFRREEDSGMKSGKLDEELDRMNQVVGKLTPETMILFNESFAATNEREGSEIARQIVTALVEHGVTVYIVTHLYEFAHIFYDKKQNNVHFLRAERQINGARTYKISEGAPLPTSFGLDLYREVFAE